MPIEGVVNDSAVILTEVVLEVGRIGLWLQTLGLIVVLWIAFQTITLFFNRKRRLAIYSIRDDLKRIEKKLDKVLKK
jgi:hypothetical protein